VYLIPLYKNRISHFNDERDLILGKIELKFFGRVPSLPPAKSFAVQGRAFGTRHQPHLQAGAQTIPQSLTQGLLTCFRWFE
jgi:hypothetical protein